MIQRLRAYIRCIQLLILLSVLFHKSSALQCRTEDGPSEAELKRVARNCMRKIGESVFSYNGNSNNNNNNNNNNYHGQQQQRQQIYGQQSSNNNYDYDQDNENNYNYDNRHYDNRNDDILRQRNRERLQMNRGGSSRTRRSSFEHTNNAGRNSNSGSGSSGGGGSNGHARNSGAVSGGSGSVGGSNQRSSTNNNYNVGNAAAGDNKNNASYDANVCVAHCFFEEMNMLNNDDYPDKHKVSYLLTKDMRERALRDFYMDTIQECFRYLDTQRRRDKCLYSRELVNCMSEYAKANCDDWQEYNVMFN